MASKILHGITLWAVPRFRRSPPDSLTEPSRTTELKHAPASTNFRVVEAVSLEESVEEQTRPTTAH
ncbi:hypothetical protein [Acidocella sp.]|uniref:hypothetical protein n=1 Tax=Acidocella sp. TaxID=50710 RepID=UPI003D02998A